MKEWKKITMPDNAVVDVLVNNDQKHAYCVCPQCCPQFAAEWRVALQAEIAENKQSNKKGSK